MPFFPELLYQLSARDQQVTWLDPLIQIASASAAQLSVDSVIDVPEGQVLLLKSVSSGATPGAAQNVDTQEILVNARGATIATRLVGRRHNPGSAISDFINWTGTILVPAGWQIRGRGTFSAGAAANATSLHVVGTLIPLGNVQRV